jgi:DNA-binding LacI/PurR family transcriptional regulator
VADASGCLREGRPAAARADVARTSQVLVAATAARHRSRAFRGLQQVGWTIGRNVRIDSRWRAGNPANPTMETTLKDVEAAARAMGLQIHIHNAGSKREIDEAFAAFMRERPDALFVAGDPRF